MKEIVTSERVLLHNLDAPPSSPRHWRALQRYTRVLGARCAPGATQSRRQLLNAFIVVAQLASVVILLAMAACGRKSVEMPTAATATAPRVANLHAFARLYGVIRWFHPSDAAAAVDWDRFAVDGSRRVLDASDSRALRSVLAELIAPIAPTVHIAATDDPFPAEPALTPASTAGLDVVAWEHEGYGDAVSMDEGKYVYASKRRHRDRTIAVPEVSYAALWQAVDARPFRGAQLRLRGKVRASSRARGQLWVRVERSDATGFFDNMNDRPVVSSTWKAAEIVGTVDADATRIVFGTIKVDAGTTWYDDLELAMQGADGSWRPIAIKDPGFEANELFASWGPGVGSPRATSIEGWNASLDRDNPASGAASLRIEAATEVMTEELFADAPAPGETVDIDLGSGLRARVPLALYSKDGHTIGDDPAAAQRSLAGAPMALSADFDAVAGVADVIVAWNVLEHFWPYWDVVGVDWIAELDVALRDALDDRNVDDHVATLQHLTVAAPDAHSNTTTCLGERKRAYPAFSVELIEGQVVVTAAIDKAVARGDVIVTVDGRPATEHLAATKTRISGSPQYRLTRASADFGTGPVGSALALRIRRAGAELDVIVARGDRMPEQYSHPSIDRLEDGVYYVDLGRARLADIDAILDRLAAAPGVVFDMRGYPNSNHAVLSHLFTRPDDSKAWMAVPHVLRPDHVATSMPAWDTYGWQMPVVQPHIGGRVAFLTGPRAASYAESVMGLVEHYRLGAIVGAPTAGTNGNVAMITTPTGCRIRFTGMRVTKHDGTRHHLVGIQPTIPASRTIAGVLAGRDEVLERGLAYVRDSK